ncbi:MAG TPA: hypothetical protein VMW38_22130 [Terriglobia bacterium]|nr:hypothetical protein [Terriglobia bacterium]
MKMRFWWRVVRVTAVTRCDLGPDEAGPSSIFMRGGELERSWGTLLRIRFGRVVAALRRGDSF